MGHASTYKKLSHILLLRRVHHGRHARHSWHPLRREAGRRGRRVTLRGIVHRHTTWRRHARGHHAWRHHARRRGCHTGHHLHRHGLGCEAWWWRRWRSKDTSKLALIRPLETWHGRTRTKRDGRGGRTSGCREGVVLASLCSKQALRGCTVSFAFAVLFEGILYCNRLVHEKLTVHGLDCGVRRFEVGIGDEAVALGLAGLWVARDLKLE
jgi:hypothetical protein